MLSLLLALGLAAGPASDIADKLTSLTRDYQSDGLREDVTFGVRVEDADWTVDSRAGVVRLIAGKPGIPTFTYVLDTRTFSRIAAGELGALTAMGQAKASDPTPMRLELADDFHPGDDFKARFLSVTSHFWTPGTPELTRFGFDHARTVHGGQAVPVYYAPGIRTAWYGILPGQHINALPSDQTNKFDSMFMIIEGGSARMRINGRELPMLSGTSIHVPAGQEHEFWNPGERPAEMVMIAFGPGA